MPEPWLTGTVSYLSLGIGSAYYANQREAACKSITEFVRGIGWWPVGGCIERVAQVHGMEIIWS